MIESNPKGRLVRFILKAVFILGSLAMIIMPMLGTRGASLGTYGGILVHGVSTVFGLIAASQASILARALVKIKAPSWKLTGIVAAAMAGGYAVGYVIGGVMLNAGAVVCIIMLILGILGAAYCTAQTGVLLSMAAISPLMLSDDERETLRRNVKDNCIPTEFTTAHGSEVLDRLLFEQGLVSRNHIRMSDE